MFYSRFTSLVYCGFHQKVSIKRSPSQGMNNIFLDIQLVMIRHDQYVSFKQTFKLLTIGMVDSTVVLRETTFGIHLGSENNGS